MSTITTISFDGDGTLWDFEQVMYHALGYALEELRQLAPAAADALTIDAMIAIRNNVARELRGTVANLEAIRLAAFEETLRQAGIADDGLAAHINRIYLKHRFEDIRLFDDVLPTLDTLQETYRIGLISNGNSYPHRCGLDGRFSFVVFSQDHGVEKPDPHLFAIALGQAGCVSGAMVHVGDSLENDVMGAQRAGIRAVWLNRERRANQSSVQPDGEIASLIELVDIMRQET